MSDEPRKGDQGKRKTQSAECRTQSFRKVLRSLLWLRHASLTVLCSSVLIVMVPSACRKQPPPQKVVNPMIDSAEKFVQVYTESLPPPQSGLDVFLDILRSKPDTTDTSSKPSGTGNPESASGAQAKPPSRAPQACLSANG